MTKKSSVADLKTLRTLVTEQMTAQEDNYTMASEKIGITDGALHQFLKGTNKGVSVEFCIKLSRYLGLLVRDVLRLGGHGDIADLWADLDLDETSDYVQKLLAAIEGLNPSEKDVIVQSARSMANAFKEQRAQYVGGKDNTGGKPHHIRSRPKT